MTLSKIKGYTQLYRGYTLHYGYSKEGICMNTTISKWGNSLGIRIPNIATKHWSLKNGDILDIEIHEDEIVIKKPRKKKQQKT